ncbi:uncharacterized protein N7459_006184 [Penicillium hispanicum]|uniref:uncharacterized protein n=1 Tax=Penicillium hispanicum TaxID=1080232 RepID=UPI002540648D|nr:uncharacterized protein N7459_006184 [Penicillium hispanicum]KAJ5580199.1 hypothetical protein N7459_006184 [Penicillium hispanicum]
MPRFLGLRGNRLNVAAILGVLMPSIMSLGYFTSAFGGVLSVQSFEICFPEIDVKHAQNRSHASSLRGTVMATFTIGVSLGTFSCIWLGDLMGRRRVILTGSITQIIGASLSASAYSLAQLIAARVIIGIGTGAVLATSPLWLSEISQANKRGSHVVTKGMFSGLGCAIALFLEYGMSFTYGAKSWRVPFACPVVFSVIVVGFILFLPESPRWLIRKTRIAEAAEILAALYDCRTDDGTIEARIKEVQASLDLAGDKRSLLQIFHMGRQRTFHRAALAIAALMFLQLTGASVTTYYTTSIFEDSLGLDGKTSRLLAAVYQLVGPIGGLVSVFTIEGFGRRRLMLVSLLGNTICLALVASLGSQAHNSMAQIGAVVFLFLYHFSYTLGFGGIPYLYATEIAPLHLRSTINSVSISISWAFSILLANVTPIAFNSIGQKYFIVFASCNAAMIPTVYFFLPETSGRSLEEIDEIFTLSENALDAVPVARRLPHFSFHEGNELRSEKSPDSVFKQKEIPV